MPARGRGSLWVTFKKMAKWFKLLVSTPWQEGDRKEKM